jgi:hypothetical protein
MEGQKNKVIMTEIEYDILDELYFFISFEKLLESVSLEEKELFVNLKNMIERNWIRVFTDVSGEQPFNELDLENNYMHYYYLATKEGFQAHNAL